MEKYNNYDNFEKVLKKIKQDSNKVSFQFSLDKFIYDGSSMDSYFADTIGSYFSYIYDNKEEVENIIATVIYELIDYFTFIASNNDFLSINIFDGIKDKYFLIEFSDMNLSDNNFDNFVELLKTISFKSVRNEYMAILEDNKKEVYVEKKFCILFLVADYKAKFSSEIDEDSKRIKNFRMLIKL